MHPSIPQCEGGIEFFPESCILCSTESIGFDLHSGGNHVLFVVCIVGVRYGTSIRCIWFLVGVVVACACAACIAFSVAR